MIIVWISKKPLEETEKEWFLYYNEIEEKYYFYHSANTDGTLKKEGNRDESPDNYKVRVPNKMIGRIFLKRLSHMNEEIDAILKYTRKRPHLGSIIIRHERPYFSIEELEEFEEEYE